MEEFMSKGKAYVFQCDACGYFDGKVKEVNEIKMQHKKLYICDKCLEDLKVIINL